jgi:hypothetical protein
VGRLNFKPTDELLTYLDRFGRRLRLFDGWLLAQRSLWIAVLAGLLIGVIGRFWPIPNLALWGLAPLAFWLLAVVGITLLRRQPPLHVARRIDAELGLKERLSTALLLKTPTGDAAEFDPELVALQRADALHAARSVALPGAYPLRLLQRPLATALLLCLGVLVLAVLPNPMHQILAERAAVARAAAEQAERMETLAEEIGRVEELTPEEREELARQLQELAAQLRANPGNREEALADLARLEEEVRRRIGGDWVARQDALASLAAQLQALAGSESSDGTAAEEAAEALQALAELLESMSPEERTALARALAGVAGEAALSGEADLAQSLAALSQAAQFGDSQAAANAARSAAAAASESERAAAAQARLQQALNQIQSGRQSIARAGTQPGAASAGASSSGQNSGQNSGNNPGDGSGNGAGANPGSGQSAGGGGGTNANRLPDATGSGQLGNQPQGAALPGRESHLDEQVYAPWQQRGETDAELFIPGQESGQGETEIRTRQDPLPGAPNAALVPYREVYGTYVDSAHQALEREAIPAGLKDYVRDYFSQLEP